MGKSARRWAERLKGKGGRETLTFEARGRAKVGIKAQAKAKAEAEPLLKRLKRSSKAVKQVEKRQRKKAKTLEECSDSPWLHKKVRVVCEGLHEGRVGLVKTVHLVLGTEPAEYQFQAQDDREGATGFFQASSSQVVVERDDWPAARHSSSTTERSTLPSERRSPSSSP